MVRVTWHSNKVVSIFLAAVFIILLLVTLRYATHKPHPKLTSPKYLRRFSWTYPGNQIPSIAPKQTNQIQNPGCKIPRKLTSYNPPENSPYSYFHPPIVHFALLFQPDKIPSKYILNFREYLSLLSYYKELKPAYMLIHTNSDVGGVYWERTQEWNGTLVMVNKIDTLSHIAGKRIVLIPHAADYVKISQVLKHGGIASDFDVIFLNRERYLKEAKRSECVLSCEYTNCTQVNGGFYSCAKHSQYLLEWLKTYHEDYRPWKWIYNAGTVPTDLLLNNSLSTCHNVFMDKSVASDPSFFDSKRWLSKGGVQWQGRTAAHYYLRYADLPEGEKVLDLDNSFGEMLRHIVSG